MKNKRRNGWMILGGISLLMAVFVIGGIEFPKLNNPSVIRTGANVSGTINLSVTIQNASHGEFTNVTIRFKNMTVNSQRDIYNTTIFNRSGLGENNRTNNTLFSNSTFDTTLIPDGIYNVTLMAFNTSHNNITNVSIYNITIDNSLPEVTAFAVNETASHYTVTTGNLSFNATITDIFNGILGRNPPLSKVLFLFDNASSPNARFNITATNTSGNWTAEYNVSKLRAGFHTVTVLANDTANNKNNSVTLTFTVNTAPNVTIITSPQGNNYTASSSSNLVFNVSARNNTRFYAIEHVLFQFDNASGIAFNVTAQNQITGLTGKFWNISYNVSKLEEGNHTVTIFANDSYANYNNSVTITFNVDKTAPGVSVTCTPTSVEQSASAPSCTCSANDNEAENQTGVKTSSFDNSVSTATTGTVTTLPCSATDYAGNTASATGSFTVTAAASSGGGVGGSGGGSSSSVAGQFSKTVWTSIFSGETATVEVDNGEVGVTEVSFDVTEDVYGAWISVNKKDSFPSSVSDFARKEYKKLEISTGPTLKEDVFENAKVKFKILKTWLAENKLEKGGVALFHFADGAWSELSTTVGEDDGTYVHYTAETPGFSYFVIGERESGVAPLPETTPAEGEAPAGSPEAAPTGEGEAPAGQGATWPWVLVVLVVLGVGAALYLMKKR